MTLSDFKAASQGDERLAWAQYLMWLDGKGQFTAAEYALFCKRTTTEWLDHWHPTYFVLADAVLAELARQLEEAWQGGYEQGRDSER